MTSRDVLTALSFGSLFTRITAVSVDILKILIILTKTKNDITDYINYF